MKDLAHYHLLSLSVLFQRSALVTELLEALLLDVVNSLTLRVISILSVCASQIYQEAISLDEADSLTLGVILFYQSAPVKI